MEAKGRCQMRRIKLAAAALVLLTLVPLDAAFARGGRAVGVHLSSARDQAAALQNESVGGPFTSVCTSSTAFGSNVMTNCDSTALPHNETAIAADPLNATHLVGGSNDSELPPSGAPGVPKEVAGYYTSFDGGRTWLNGQLPPG